MNSALQPASLFLSNSHRPIPINASDGDLLTFSGLLIFRGKKSKISRNFQGQIRGRICRIRGIFAGKKSKVAEKSADFAGF